jgi:hypothetical protein
MPVSSNLAAHQNKDVTPRYAWSRLYPISKQHLAKGRTLLLETSYKERTWDYFRYNHIIILTTKILALTPKAMNFSVLAKLVTGGFSAILNQIRFLCAANINRKGP